MDARGKKRVRNPTVAKKTSRNTNAGGIYHDLPGMLAVVLETLLCQHSVEGVRISWMSVKLSNKRKNDLFDYGVCLIEDRHIQINRLMDQSWVPGWYVEFVIFHEVLHLIHKPFKRRDGVTVCHSVAFKQAERKYPCFQKALRWELQTVDRLSRTRLR